MRIDLRVNGRAVSIEAAPLRPLLHLLREDLGLTGAKEGCGEGECGACAVLLDGALVQACLVPAFQARGREVTTVEGLVPESAAHPADPVLSRAFLEEGAAQCGFCTPGMIMAAHACVTTARSSHEAPDREQIRTALAGNLCRCTGYAAIVRAVERAIAADRERGALAETPVGGGAPLKHTGHSLEHMGPEGACGTGCEPALPGMSGAVVFSPTSLAEALDCLRTQHAIPVAGATDLLTARLGAPEPGSILDLGRIPELAGIRVHPGEIEIGAITTIAAIASDPGIAAGLPALTEAAGLFGAAAIRNRATLGGNLMTASPAADTVPPLLALGARVVLSSAEGSREVPLSGFYTSYRRTVRRENELLVRILVPIPGPQVRQAFYKVGTRRAQSIAKLSLAACAQLESGILRSVRFAAGSVGPVPMLLTEVQARCEGARLDPALAREAGEIAAREARPIDDVRSTAHYRRTVLGRLVTRFLSELRESFREPAGPPC